MNDTEERVFHEIMFVSDNSRMFILHTLLYWITQKQICDFRAKKANRVNKICLCHISHACVPFDTFTGYTLTRWLRRGTYWLNISFLRCGVGQYGHKWRFRKTFKYTTSCNINEKLIKQFMLNVDSRINHTNNDKINLFSKTNIKIIPKKI